MKIVLGMVLLVLLSTVMIFSPSAQASTASNIVAHVVHHEGSSSHQHHSNNDAKHKQKDNNDNHKSNDNNSNNNNKKQNSNSNSNDKPNTNSNNNNNNRKSDSNNGGRSNGNSNGNSNSDVSRGNSNDNGNGGSGNSGGVANHGTPSGPSTSKNTTAVVKTANATKTNATSLANITTTKTLPANISKTKAAALSIAPQIKAKTKTDRLDFRTQNAEHLAMSDHRKTNFTNIAKLEQQRKADQINFESVVKSVLAQTEKKLQQQQQQQEANALPETSDTHNSNSTGTPLSHFPLNHFVTQSQAIIDQQYIDCWHNPQCKPHIAEKFNAKNLPDCDTTNMVGICWDHRHQKIQE